MRPTEEKMHFKSPMRGSARPTVSDRYPAMLGVRFAANPRCSDKSVRQRAFSERPRIPTSNECFLGSAIVRAPMQRGAKGTGRGSSAECARSEHQPSGGDVTAALLWPRCSLMPTGARIAGRQRRRS